MLGAIAGVDAHVFGGEVAGPIAGSGATSVEIDDKVDMRFEQAVAGGAFVEIQRLAFAQDGNARHVDVHALGIEFHS